MSGQTCSATVPLGWEWGSLFAEGSETVSDECRPKPAHGHGSDNAASEPNATIDNRQPGISTAEGKPGSFGSSGSGRQGAVVALPYPRSQVRAVRVLYSTFKLSPGRLASFHLGPSALPDT